MKSTELYAQLRSSLGALFKAAGFRRARTSLSWQRPADDGFLLVWFQCDKWGWDKHSGSGFFINFQIAPTSEPGHGRTERLQYFLPVAELEEVRAIQNGVIARLAPPPTEYVDLLRREFTRLYPRSAAQMLDTYLGAFKPVTEPYRSTWDFTLRYYDEVDVGHWATLLQRVCPRIVSDLSQGFPPAQGSAESSH
jgi:hypothetical protein